MLRRGFARPIILLLALTGALGGFAVQRSFAPDLPPHAFQVTPDLFLPAPGDDSWVAVRDLSGHEIQPGMDLRGLAFRGVDLHEVTFTACDLRGVDFTGANLYRARFWACDPRGATLPADL